MASLSSGDQIKFNLLRIGTPVKISRFMGPRVSVSLLGGKDVYEDILMGEEIQITNPHLLPIDMQIRHGFAPPPPPPPQRW